MQGAKLEGTGSKAERVQGGKLEGAGSKAERVQGVRLEGAGRTGQTLPAFMELIAKGKDYKYTVSFEINQVLRDK